MESFVSLKILNFNLYRNSGAAFDLHFLPFENF